MKQFCFFNEDEIDNLPKDFKLIPFDVSFLEPKTTEKPKISTSKKLPWAHRPSVLAMPELSSQNPID